eukprot:6202579-Pleurochrysis_carterae.AAC.1
MHSDRSDGVRSWIVHAHYALRADEPVDTSKFDDVPFMLGDMEDYQCAIEPFFSACGDGVVKRSIA